ncbi:MAG: cytochrome C, partial [Sulfurimonas sp.]
FMNYKRSARIVNSLRVGEVADSISKTPYMIEKHKDIREDLIIQEEVKGIFNCTACHTTAQKGIYSEKDILIPNFGRWED